MSFVCCWPALQAHRIPAGANAPIETIYDQTGRMTSVSAAGTNRLLSGSSGWASMVLDTTFWFGSTISQEHYNDGSPNASLRKRI